MQTHDLPSQVNFPALEEEVIAYWKEHHIFEKSLTNRASAPHWTFLDGPPFITGMPHYGSLLSSLPKDVFPRFWTMKGYYVRRVWGWDCHGLPAENKVENQLKLKRKKDIEEKIGIKTFIDECKKYVSQVSSEWSWYIDHIGRWVDYEHAYRTMDTDYMESVMWVFRQMYDKGHIYKGLRVSLYCPHCSTPISNFEVAMDAEENYKPVTEPSNTYKYQLADEKDTYILAWSTTPWTKLVTPALAVNPEFTYVKVKQNNQFLILADTTLSILSDEPYEIMEKIPGTQLIGRRFVPHYDFLPKQNDKQQWVIIPGNFVTADEGTGVVTIAAYGEDDLRVMQEHNIQIMQHLDDEGFLVKSVPNWAGMSYLEANPLINQDLTSRGLMYSEKPHEHRVPLCWRCHTRLIYAPQNAWYVNVQNLKDTMAKTNEATNWVPDHFKYGRFLKSMQSAPDWCISRSRYWGSPVPVWECECGNRYVPGSIAELEKLSTAKITELHRPEIDQVTIPCSCGKTAHRVPEVLDSWIEAGSAAFAERHFPFSQTEKLEDFFPPDFIAEYTGQIRAWFYVMHVIGAAIYEQPAFKNVLVTGVVLGTDGRKMSKNYGNYPDPKLMIQTHGADALRLYLLGSPVMHGEDIRISEVDYRNAVRSTLMIFWNCFKYFTTYAKLTNWQPSQEASRHMLDLWIKSRLASTHLEVNTTYEAFDTVNTIKSLQKLIDDLSTWYIRRSRDRVGNEADVHDQQAFLDTLYHVLTRTCQLMAPIAPFISEYVYRYLTDTVSVHVTDWPDFIEGDKNVQLEEDMAVVRQIVEKGHSARKNTNIPVRQPLQKVTITSSQITLEPELLSLIKDELNVKDITWNFDEKTPELSIVLDTQLSDSLKAEGQARDLIRKIQVARKEAGCDLSEQVIVILPSWPQEFTDHIKQATLAKELQVGGKLEIVRG